MSQEEEVKLTTRSVQEEVRVMQDTQPMELPVFSSGVKTALLEGKSNEVWSQMIDELVMFYGRKFPSRLKCSEDYQLVRRMMYSTYPTIGRFGTDQWVG